MGSQAFSGSPASAEARAALDAIRRIVRMLRESSGAAERRAGVSGAQLFVLQQLRSRGAALSLRALAERTATHESSVSVVVQRLVDAGLVARRRSREDARRVELSLLPAGRALLRRAPPLAQEKLIAALERLEARERRSLARSLEALVARLGLAAQPPAMFFEGASRGR